jgi:GDPmannose 4,6-dehydratase
MRNKKILIAGITGQDGYYLAKKLLRNNIIIGLSRKKAIKIHKNIKIIKTDYNFNHLKKIITSYQPNIIFNLACQSNPVQSWVKPEETIFSIVNINLNFLEIIRNKNIKYFNASSSEIFARTENRLNEDSYIFPDNPYGCSKAFSHFLVSSYRKKYKIYAVNGIFFNHESTRRRKNFLGKKLITETLNIKYKKQKIIKLLNKRPVRDFGYAEDYIDAAIKIMKLKKPDDFIIATGISKSVEEFAYEVCEQLNIKRNVIKFKSNKKIINNIVLADTKKIRNKTNWKPKYSFKEMISKMIKDEIHEKKKY